MKPMLKLEKLLIGITGEYDCMIAELPIEPECADFWLYD
jgi:hypothetical protein